MTIRGVRYANPGRPPVILVHGYAGNSRNWREIGYWLFARGFDVWMPNLRGHGRGTHRSVAKHDGNYSFISIVAEDFPAIVDHVVMQTRKTAALVGHSLGGVAARAYLSGVVREAGGRIQIDPVRSEEIAKKKIRTLIVVGSPPHYRNVPKAIRFVVSQVPQVVEILMLATPLPSANRAPTSPGTGGIVEHLRSQILEKMDMRLRSGNFIRGIVELENFDHDKNEFARLLKKGTSKVPMDLVRDVNLWIKGGDVVLGEDVNLSKMRLIRTPILFIAGDLDWLGPYRDIIQEAAEYRGRIEVRAVLIRKTSHLDLISGERAGRLVGDLIARFMKNPKEVGFGDRHETI